MLESSSTPSTGRLVPNQTCFTREGFRAHTSAARFGCSDKTEFCFWVNGGMTMNLSEPILILLEFRPTLNQRVPGSSPGAPTNLINDLDLAATSRHGAG